MSSQRDRQKLAQRFLKEKGFYDGKIDGLWGRVSEAAFVARERKTNPIPRAGDIAPPASDYYSLVRAFGKPGDESKLVRFSFPYAMKLSWDKPLVAVLEELLEHYGMDGIRKHGLDLYGGVYNNRSVRGGRSKSTHAFGAAIDLNPEHNGNRVPWVSGKQGQRGFGTMPLAAIKIFEKHGFKSAARAWGRDAMHFQFTQ